MTEAQVMNRRVLVLLVVSCVVTHGWAQSDSCITSSDCHTQFECQNSVCVHKDLLPISGLDIALTLICFLGCIMSVVGGVGGGGLFVPLLMLITKFQADSAVPLSKAMIFGAACIAFAWESQKKVNGRPSVDYNVCLLLQPLCLCGTIVGVFMNVVLPTWFIVILLSLVLGWATYKTFMKGLQVHRKYREKAFTAAAAKSNLWSCFRTSKKADVEDEIIADLTSPLLTESTSPTSIDSTVDSTPSSAVCPIEEGFYRDPTAEPLFRSSSVLVTQAPLPENASPRDRKLYLDYCQVLSREESVGYWKILLMFAMWAVLAVCAISKKHIPPACGGGFFTVAFLPIPIAITVTVWFGNRLRSEHALKQHFNHAFLKSDFIWNKKHTMVFPLFSFVGGLAAGMVGIGGGMVLGPLLLVMSKESNPDITTAISTVMVLFTSSSTTLQFIVLNRLRFDYAALLAGFTIVSALIAKLFVKPWIDRGNKKSYILFSLAIVLGVSGVLSIVEGLLAVANNQGRMQFDFTKICGSAE